MHRTVVDDLETVFAAMYDAEVPLERVERIEAYDGSDDASMAANTSHAFNCRRITGGGSWPQHAFGIAVDLNPAQNPDVRDGTVLPPEGEAYLDRSDVREGMVLEGGVVVDAFDAIGWTWGGRWNTLKDYQHFERP